MSALCTKELCGQSSLLFLSWRLWGDGLSPETKMQNCLQSLTPPGLPLVGANQGPCFRKLHLQLSFLVWKYQLPLCYTLLCRKYLLVWWVNVWAQKWFHFWMKWRWKMGMGSQWHHFQRVRISPVVSGGVVLSVAWLWGLFGFFQWFLQSD